MKEDNVPGLLLLLAALPAWGLPAAMFVVGMFVGAWLNMRYLRRMAGKRDRPEQGTPAPRKCPKCVRCDGTTRHVNNGQQEFFYCDACSAGQDFRPVGQATG